MNPGVDIDSLPLHRDPFFENWSAGGKGSPSQAFYRQQQRRKYVQTPSAQAKWRVAQAAKREERAQLAVFEQ